MARPSKDLDKKLLNVGKNLIKTKGIDGFSLRDLAQKAQVNLGMITYYFASKEGYLKALLMNIYEPFIKELGEALESKNDSIAETLEKQLFYVAKFSRDHSKLILPLLIGVAQGNVITIKLLKNDFTIHFKLLEESVRGYLSELNIDEKKFPEVLQFFLSSVALSNLLGEVKGKLTSQKYVVTDDMLRLRVKAALSGVVEFGKGIDEIKSKLHDTSSSKNRKSLVTVSNVEIAKPRTPVKKRKNVG